MIYPFINKVHLVGINIDGDESKSNIKKVYKCRVKKCVGAQDETTQVSLYKNIFW